MADSAKTISGVVLDPQGKPVEGARVYFTETPAPMPDIAVMTGGDGRFQVGAGRPGVYRIAAAADEFGTVEIEFDPAKKSTLELRLKPAR